MPSNAPRNVVSVDVEDYFHAEIFSGVVQRSEWDRYPCRVESNTGLGLHPGSGSQRPIVRENHAIGNGSDGIFVCWRVKHGLFEKNESRDNP